MINHIEYDERSGKGKQSEIPEEIRRWNWGALGLGFIWGIAHSVYFSLLAIAGPVLGIMIMSIYTIMMLQDGKNADFAIIIGWLGYIAGYVVLIMLGLKGNEMAWRGRKWKNVEHFVTRQNKWKIWGIVCFIIFTITPIVRSIVTPSVDPVRNTLEMIKESYQDRTAKNITGKIENKSVSSGYVKTANGYQSDLDENSPISFSDTYYKEWKLSVSKDEKNRTYYNFGRIDSAGKAVSDITFHTASNSASDSSVRNDSEIEAFKDLMLSKYYSLCTETFKGKSSDIVLPFKDKTIPAVRCEHQNNYGAVMVSLFSFYVDLNYTHDLGITVNSTSTLLNETKDAYGNIAEMLQFNQISASNINANSN